MAAPRRPIFAIFEGGGAKGIAHIGALKALETNGFELAGVAGTSAGALIATLAAAGYKADDILNPDLADNNILTRFGRRPVDLLESEAWRRLGRLRRCLGRLVAALLVGGAATAASVAPRAALVARSIWRNSGYLSTEKVRAFLNFVLRERLLDLHTSRGMPQARIPNRIRFRDLDYTTFAPPDILPLKIVATNLRTKSLFVFDGASTPDVEVAEAVAASIAIPLVFRPVTLTSYRDPGPFVDGGLVSNFPIWIFAEEKLAFERANSNRPPVPIAGFTLVERPTALSREGGAQRSRGFVDFATDLATTAIFGSQSVSQRFVEDLLVAPLQTDLGTLDFEEGWPRFRQAYMDGKRCAAERLQSALVIKPDRVKAKLAESFATIRAAIDNARAARGAPPLAHSRANLISRYGTDSFRIVHGVNMEADADDRLIIDARSKGAPEAFDRREPVLLDTGGKPISLQASYMTKYERALVRSTVVSVICMPVFPDLAEWSRSARERPEPMGIFCFDSDEDLAPEFSNDDIKRQIAIESVRLSDALME